MTARTKAEALAALREGRGVTHRGVEIPTPPYRLSHRQAEQWYRTCGLAKLPPRPTTGRGGRPGVVDGGISITVRLDPAVVERLDAARGDEPRAVWVRRTIDAALSALGESA